MAGELQADHLTGRPVYFLIRDTTSRIWNGAAFEAYSALNYANYYISGAEQGATGYFTASAPAMAAGLYYYLAKDRQGGSPAEGDPTVTAGDLQWTGSGVQGVYLAPVTPTSGAYVVGTVLSGTTYLNSGVFASVLTYDFSGLVVSSGIKCLLNANRKLTNKWDLSAASGYLTVYGEDNSTVAYKQSVSSASGALPVTGLSP